MACATTILFGMTQCDLLKISEEELQIVTDVSDIHEAVHTIRNEYPIPLILVTKGEDGSVAFYKGIKVERPAFLQKKTIYTTGAGDTFFACVINHVLEHGLDTLTEANLKSMLTFANAAASLITTKKGALRVMPGRQEVLDFINSFL